MNFLPVRDDVKEKSEINTGFNALMKNIASTASLFNIR